MRNYEYYLEKAKQNQGFLYDNQIDEALGFKGSMTTMIKKGKRHLSDESMVKLAQLAGEKPEQALLDLNVWRAPDSVKSTYATILQKLTHTTAAICILAASTLTYTAPSHAASLSSGNADCVSYGKLRRIYVEIIKLYQLLKMKVYAHVKRCRMPYLDFFLAKKEIYS